MIVSYRPSSRRPNYDRGRDHGAGDAGPLPYSVPEATQNSSFGAGGNTEQQHALRDAEFGDDV
jgi:hypothetical protein